MAGYTRGLPSRGGCAGWGLMFGPFALLDVFVLGAYFAVIGWVAWSKGRRENDTEDFVVGGRRVPWVAVLLSIVATEISAVTFLAVTGTGFESNLTYLQFGIGTIFGRVVVAVVFLRAYYSGQVMTVYQYLAQRFGNRTRYTATAVFLLSRLVAASIRLSLAAIGFHVILDIPVLWTLSAFTLFAIAYTFWGGIKAVIWTDVVQAVVFIGGGLAAMAFLVHDLGWATIWSTAQAEDKLEMIRLAPDDSADVGWLSWLNDPGLFFLAFINGMVMIIASLGTDQDLSQRMLTCRDVRGAQRSVILSGIVGIPVAALFLFVGIAIFAYAEARPEFLAAITHNGEVASSHVFAAFIRDVLPAGLKGLLVAGIFASAMSSIDSAMSALASSAMVDLYRPLVRRKLTEAHYLMVTRVGVVFFGLILLALAWSVRDTGNFLWLALQVAGIPAGALLGIFLLGLLTRRGTDRWNVIAMATGLAVTTLLFIAIRLGWTGIAWPWIVILGTALTFGIGAAAQRGGR